MLTFVVEGCMAGIAQEALSPLPAVNNGFVVISHRGNHVNVPENTLASLQAAIAAGADYAEIDLRTTKDGALVLSHDATVDRMTDGKGNVKDLTLEEIKQLTIKGHAAATDHTVYRIPEFRDVLKVCKDRINIYLDFKDADPAEAYRQIQAAGMERQVLVYLNKAEQYKLWKKAAPAMPLMTSLPDGIRTPAQLELFLGQARVAVLDNVQDTAMVQMARQKGVAVWLDVEGPDETPAIWDLTMRKGVQGMQTDHPEAMTGYLVKNNLRNGLAVSGTARPAPVASAAPAYRKLADIPYGRDDDAQVLDAYIPDDYQDARVIVYLHGGGWTGGDKGEFPAALVEELVGRRKYIVVSMNYRLVKDGKNRFPAQIEDIRKALAFLSSHAGKYHYNGNEYALMGGSAGGYLAMLYAYGYDTAKQVKAVVDCWGPTDLADKAVRADNKDADSKVVNLLGVADPEAAICRDASPYYRVTKETGVPTLLFHGGEDPLVHVSQAEKMYKKLRALGIPAQYEMYPHEHHGVGGASAVDMFMKMLAWLQQYYPAGTATGSGPAPAVAAKIPAVALGVPYSERLGFPKGAKVVIFHVDDAGMSWYSNQGAIKSIDSGVATSTSIMMPCSWAASFAKYAAGKGIDAGLHLTLTAEWNDYRWPPLAGAKNVPGLVDKTWCLWPEPEDVVAHASADEIEKEIRAQVERALAIGMKPTHLDSHMGTLFASRAYLERYIKVGVEYGIPVMFPGGNDKLLIEGYNQPLIERLKKEGKYQEGMALPVPAEVKDAAAVGNAIWAAGLPVLDDLLTISGNWKPAPDASGKVSPAAYEKYKVKKFKEALRHMQPGVAMFIVHSTDLGAGMGEFGHISGSGGSRYADMQAMMDPELRAYIRSEGIILTTWRELMERRRQVK